MKAAIFDGPGQRLRLSDVPIPKAGPGEVLLRIAACGVCHTDLHYLHGTPTQKQPPLILGHEASGTVEDVGEGVNGFKKGDRVLVTAVYGCTHCYYCRTGRENLCQDLAMYGNTIDGSYAEYVKTSQYSLIPLPSELALEESSVIADALSTPYHAVVNRARVQPGETIAIFGCGGVGLNAVQVAAASSATVLAVDINDEKLNLASSLGAAVTINAQKEDAVKGVKRMTGTGVDVAVEAIGNPTTIKQALESVRRGGRVVVVGYSAQDVPLTAARIMFRELDILGSLGARTVDYPRIVDLVRRGKLRLLVSKKFPLERINEALDLLHEGKILTRAIVTPK